MFQFCEFSSLQNCKIIVCFYVATQEASSEAGMLKEETVVLNKRKQQCRDNVKLWQRMREFLFDKEETLHRSQKLLHVLASVTVRLLLLQTDLKFQICD